MGSTISPPQLALLKASGMERLTVLLDGDAAGRAATAATLGVLSQHFFVRAPGIPDGTQPDSLSEETLRTLLAA